MRAVAGLGSRKPQLLFNLTLLWTALLVSSGLFLLQQVTDDEWATRLSLSLPAIAGFLALLLFAAFTNRSLMATLQGMRKRPWLSSASLSAVSAVVSFAWLLGDGMGRSIFSFEPFAIGQSLLAKVLSVLVMLTAGFAILVGVVASRLRWGSLVSSILVLVALVIYVPRTSAYLGQGDATVFLDELLAPAAGKWPLVDFIPQYSTLLGWPLAGLRPGDKNEVLQSVVQYVSLLQIITLVVAVSAISLATSFRYMWLPAILVPSVTLMSIYGTQAVSDIWTNFPNRVFLPTVTFFLLTVATRVARQSLIITSVLMANFTAGAALLNNFDFGLICAGATALVSCVLLFKRGQLRFVIVVLVIMVPFGLYSFVGRLYDRTPNYSLSTLAAQGFIADSPFHLIFLIPPIGWPILVLASFAASMAVSLALLRGSSAAMRPNLSIAIAMLYLSLLGLGSFIYYAARPVPIVATAMLPFWAALVCLIAIFFFSRIELVNEKVKPYVLARSLLVVAPVFSLVGALSVTLFSQPSWLASVRISSDRAINDSRWGYQQALPKGLLVDFQVAQPDGNLLKITTGIENPLAFSSVLALVVQPLREEQCRRWQADGKQSVLVWVGESLVNPPLESLSCPGATTTRLDENWIRIEFN